MQAVVFDFDGLILDTESPSYQTFVELYREYGAELPLEEWERVVGCSDSDFDPLYYLEGCVRKKLDREALERRRRQHHLALIERGGMLIPRGAMGSPSRPAPWDGNRLGLQLPTGNRWKNT